jgi:hypothetical protein
MEWDTGDKVFNKHTWLASAAQEEPHPTALPMTFHTLATTSPHAPKAATHLRVHAPLGTQSEHRSLQLSSTRPPRATRAERGAPPPELRAGIRGHRGHDAGKDTPEAKRKAGLGDMDAPRG